MDSCRSSLKIGFSGSVSYLFQFMFLLLGNHLLLTNANGSVNGELAVAVFDLIMNCSYLTTSVYQAASEAMQPLAATFIFCLYGFDYSGSHISSIMQYLSFCD